MTRNLAWSWNVILVIRYVIFLVKITTPCYSVWNCWIYSVFLEILMVFYALTLFDSWTSSKASMVEFEENFIFSLKFQFNFLPCLLMKTFKVFEESLTLQLITKRLFHGNKSWLRMVNFKNNTENWLRLSNDISKFSLNIYDILQMIYIYTFTIQENIYLSLHMTRY